MVKPNIARFVWCLFVVAIGAPAVSAEEVLFQLTGPVPEANCIQCHGWREAITAPRLLNQPHQARAMAHGSRSLWCLDCHLPESPEELRVAVAKSVPYAQAHLSCMTCHAKTVRAWQHGIHGKRMENWRGARIMARCSVCHNPHDTAWKQRLSVAPPSRPKRAAEDQEP